MDSSMMLKMKGSIINWNDKMFVEVQCTSCRDPYLNRMEYTLNSNVEDIVSFHSPSRTCFHFSGECAVPLCSCSPMGNEFTRAYEKNGENKMTITCGAMFPVVSTVISRVANLVYDGKEGKYVLIFFPFCAHQKYYRVRLVHLNMVKSGIN